MKAIFLRLGKKITLTVVVIAFIVWFGNYIHRISEFWDNDPNRGASVDYIGQPDRFGDQFNKVVYPDQGWDASQSLWFYNTTQGSDLLPYDFFLALEQVDSKEPFRSPTNINRYCYLVQKPTHHNPDGLPVGLVKDTYQGESSKTTTYVGFTCAACHTA